MERDERTNMAYWYPRIERARLPVPATAMVHTDLPLIEMVEPPWEGGTLDATQHSNFLLELIGAADKVRYSMGPFFLRSGYTSGKHNWEQTCYVQSHNSIGDHVYHIVEYSAMADVVGLPVQDWAVRQLLPTNPVLILPKYGNMPVVREFRFFVDNTPAGVTGVEVTHVQPYWPRGALLQGMAPADEARNYNGVDAVLPGLDRLRQPDYVLLRDMAKAAGRAVGGGHWSVDFLEDRDGRWWLTDMAEGDRSFKYGIPGWAVQHG